MAKQVEDGFLREIDEELRQEHYAKLWKRFGGFIIAGAVALVALVAGYQGWRNYDISNRNELGERFALAQNMILDNNRAEAQAAFSAIAEGANAGYALLARFQNASLKALHSGSSAGYMALSQDMGIDAVYRDLAVILAVTHESGVTDSKLLMERLAPLSADNNPWRFSALELTGVLAMSTGDVDKARETFKNLSENAVTPQGMRGRATELLAAIGQ